MRIHAFVVMIVSVSALLTGGCAYSGTDLIATGRVTAEPRIDRALRAVPDIHEESGDLVISGQLARGIPIGRKGHVDVTVTDPAGTVIYDAQLNYQSAPTSSHAWSGPKYGVYRRIPSRYGAYGEYSVIFPGLPPEGSIIRIRHHGTPHSESDNE